MVRVACIAGLAALAIGFGASCFDPSYPQGLSCGQDGECPPGQECDEVQGICVVEGEGGGDPDAGDGTSDPDASRGGTDGGVDAAVDADIDASPAECTAQEIDDCDATCAEQGQTGQCTADGCECVDGGVRFAEAQLVPCTFPATKVEAVRFGDFFGYVGINEEGFFACFDAFDPESREGAPIDGATDFWVGNLFGDDQPSAAVSTAAQPVVAVRMESGTLSAETHPASNENQSYVVGTDLDDDGFTDILLSGSILTSLRQSLGGIFTEQKVNGNVPITEGTIFPDLLGAGTPSVVSVVSGGEELSLLVRPDATEERRKIAVGGGVGSGHLAATRGAADALPDVIADVEGGIVGFVNEGGALGEGIFYELDVRGPLATGDFGGDGVDEVVGFDSGGNVAIFGRENFLPSLIDTLTFDVGSQPKSLSVGDLDGDGLLDILVATAEGMFWYQQQP